MIVEVKKEDCEGCGTCVTICPNSAIVLKESKGVTIAEVIPELCDGCAQCVEFCFQEAIKPVQ